MSLHVISLDAQNALRKQKKKQAILSMVTALFAIIILMLLLSIFLLQPVTKESPVIITYSPANEQEQTLDPKKVQISTTRTKPSAPSSSMSRVIASSVVSDIAIPVVDVDVTEPSLEFGSSSDFGSGWDDGNGFGSGTASFFGNKAKAKRVAYVIDYSASMKGERDVLMRKELARSIGELKGKIQYQLIFFAGPSWVAGDQVQVAMKGGTSKVISNMAGSKTEVYEWSSTGNPNSFKPKDTEKLQKASWLTADSQQIEKSLELIRETPLIYGTVWEPAIDMALRMEPKPDVIFFMTDGTTGGNALLVAERIGKRAKEEGVVINTVAMMDPKTKDAMLKMSEESLGTFVLIKEDGKPYDKDGKPLTPAGR